jgi:tripartite-type tricarboxylate transporter receptor subunit TctC
MQTQAIHRPAINTRRTVLGSLAAIAVSGSIGAVAAQDYPSHPITMGMPFAAGGPGDVLARALAEGMRQPLGQNVLVDNITGAAGSIGTGVVARAAPDGYSLILGNWTTHVVNAVAYALPYDVVKDFEPVALVATQPVVVIARSTLPANNLQELIAWLKANPDKATSGNAGIGSATHVASVFFQQETGTHFQLVPYRGGAPAMVDLLAGNIDMMFDLATDALPQIRSGKVKAFAVTAKNRIGAAPDIPTSDESGVPALHIALWNGLWAPRGTPKPIIDKLDAAVVTALSDEQLRARLTDLGIEIAPRDEQNPQSLAGFQKAEIAKWWPLIKSAGIKAQ